MWGGAVRTTPLLILATEAALRGALEPALASQTEEAQAHLARQARSCKNAQHLKSEIASCDCSATSHRVIAFLDNCNSPGSLYVALSLQSFQDLVNEGLGSIELTSLPQQCTGSITILFERGAAAMLLYAQLFNS